MLGSRYLFLQLLALGSGSLFKGLPAPAPLKRLGSRLPDSRPPASGSRFRGSTSSNSLIIGLPVRLSLKRLDSPTPSSGSPTLPGYKSNALET